MRAHPHGRHLFEQRRLRHVRVLGGVPRVDRVERARVRHRGQRVQRGRGGQGHRGACGGGPLLLRALHALHGRVDAGDPLVHLQHHSQSREVRVRGLGPERPRLLAGGRGLRHLPHPGRRRGGREPRGHDHDRDGRFRRVGEPGRDTGHVLRQGGQPLPGLRARPQRIRSHARKRLRLRLRGAARHRAHRAQEGGRRDRHGGRAGGRDARRGRLPGELRSRRRDGDGRGDDRRRDNRVRGHPPRRGRDQGGVAFRRLPARPGGPPHRGDGGDGAVGRRGRRGVAGRRVRRARAARRLHHRQGRRGALRPRGRHVLELRPGRRHVRGRGVHRLQPLGCGNLARRQRRRGAAGGRDGRPRRRGRRPVDRVQRIAGRMDGFDRRARCRTGPTRSWRRRPPKATPARGS